MKKNNKIIALGLGLSLIFAPVSGLVTDNTNLVYAKQDLKEYTITHEEFLKKAQDFVKTEQFLAQDVAKQNEYKELIKDLKVEDLDEDTINLINEKIDEIELSYISNQYTELKKEVMNLKADNLSDKLLEEIDSYEDNYETYDKYNDELSRLKNTKKSIEDYNINLTNYKNKLKKAIDDNKDLNIDLKNEKSVLENNKSKLDDVDKAFKNLNKKVNDYNKEVKEKNIISNLKTLKKIIDGENSTKQSENYKWATKNLKEDFDKSVQAAKDAHQKLNKKVEVNNVDKIIDNYYNSFDKLDGEKNLSEYKYNNLVDFYKKNRYKLSSENQKKYDKLVEGLKDSEDISLDSINNLKKSIEEDIKKDSRSLPTGTLSKQKNGRIGVRKTIAPKVKRSRSFVRTGVKSVWIFLAILIIALASYFFISKKDKK